MDQNHIDKINTASEYLSFHGITLLEAENGSSKVVMNINNSIANIYGTVHGGALFTLADTAAGSACYSRKEKCVTLNSTIHFIHPGIKGVLTAYGKEVSRGRKTGIYDVTITDEDDKIVCSATFTFFILDH